MNSEYLMNDVEAILDDNYPKSEFEGDYVTIDNTVKNLRGQVICDEETEVKVCNKNICCFKNTSNTSHNITCTAENCNITLDGISSGGGNFFYLNKLDFVPGKTYTVSSKPISGTAIPHSSSTTWATLFYPFQSDNGSKYRLPISPDSNNSITFTIPEDLEIGISYLWMGWSSESVVGEDSIFDNFKFQIQIEEGETGTDFLEHQEQNYTGKNITFKTYDGLTHVYNSSEINMTVLARQRKDDE